MKLKPRLKLIKGTRLTSFLFIATSIAIAAGVLWAANTYYDIDTGEIVVGDIQRVANVIRATTGIIVGGTASQSPDGGVKFQVASGNVLFDTSGTIEQTGTGQVTFAGNVNATNGLDVTGANLTVGGTNFSVDVSTGNATTAGDLTIGGGDLIATTTAFNLLNTNVTTLNFAGAASTLNIGTSSGFTMDVPGALTVEFSTSTGGFILRSESPVVKYLEVNSDGALTLRSGGSADLNLDAASGAVRVAAGDTLYVDNIAVGGAGKIIGIVPIFGFDLPAQTASTSYVQVSRTLENYPFPATTTGNTRVHKLIFRYAASTTDSLVWRISTTTGATYSSSTLPIPGSNNLDKGNAYIATTTIPTDDTDWWLEIKTPDISSVVRIYQIFLAAYDVK